MEMQDGIQEIIEQNKNKRKTLSKKRKFLLCASEKKIPSSDTFPGQQTLAQISWTEITAKAFRELVVKGAENISHAGFRFELENAPPDRRREVQMMKN